MRWSASAPVTWPVDAVWQQAWQTTLEPLLTTALGADGTLTTADGRDERIRLVGGTHLAPGATYQVAPELATGQVSAWVGPDRAMGAEWAPLDEPGRLHVEVHGLDRLVEARAGSTLRDLTGTARFALDPEHLLDLELEIPWLRIEVTARASVGRLQVEVRVRGLGLWWPTLAPLLTAGSGRIQEGLQESVDGMAESITQLPSSPDLAPDPPRPPSFEELDRAHAAQVRAAMTEAGRRQHQVDEAMRLVSWPRRTPDRWRQALADLGPGVWPTTEPLVTPADWGTVEESLTEAVVQHPRWRRGTSIDGEVATMTAALLSRRRAVDHAVADADGAMTTVMGDEPAEEHAHWLTDERTDLSWLATPWSTVRYLTGAASDDEARAHVERAAGGLS